MNQYLPKASRDVDEALDYVRMVWNADDHEAIMHLALSVETLTRAAATMVQALAAITIALRDLEKEP